jgi:hypothetical protein
MALLGTWVQRENYSWPNGRKFGLPLLNDKEEYSHSEREVFVLVEPHEIIKLLRVSTVEVTEGMSSLFPFLDIKFLILLFFVHCIPFSYSIFLLLFHFFALLFTVIILLVIYFVFFPQLFSPLLIYFFLYWLYISVSTAERMLRNK